MKSLRLSALVLLPLLIACGASSGDAQSDDQDVVTCMAMPNCEAGDTGSRTDCARGEESTCYVAARCGKKITCRKPTAEKTVEGTLTRTMGIGGENTGMSVATPEGLLELVLDQASMGGWVDGRYARVTGKPTTLTGVETGERPALQVTKLLACPASGAVFNCMPPLSPDDTVCGADRGWISEKCEGVSYLD